MQSRIFRGLLGPLLSVTALATCVATYETLREVQIYDSQTWQLTAACMHAISGQIPCSTVTLVHQVVSACGSTPYPVATSCPLFA